MLALRFTDFDPKRSLAGQHAYRDLWNIAGAGLVRFYVRELDHLLPLFDVVRDNPSEGGRRAPEHGTAQLRNPCDDFRVAGPALISRLSLSIISSGVFLGAPIPCQPEASKPFRKSP